MGESHTGFSDILILIYVFVKNYYIFYFYYFIDNFLGLFIKILPALNYWNFSLKAMIMFDPYRYNLFHFFSDIYFLVSLMILLPKLSAISSEKPTCKVYFDWKFFSLYLSYNSSKILMNFELMHAVMKKSSSLREFILSLTF